MLIRRLLLRRSSIVVCDTDYSKVLNENCGNRHSEDVNLIEFACSCNDVEPNGKVNWRSLRHFFMFAITII